MDIQVMSGKLPSEVRYFFDPMKSEFHYLSPSGTVIPQKSDLLDLWSERGLYGRHDFAIVKTEGHRSNGVWCPADAVLIELTGYTRVESTNWLVTVGKPILMASRFRNARRKVIDYLRKEATRYVRAHDEVLAGLNNSTTMTMPFE